MKYEQYIYDAASQVKDLVTIEGIGIQPLITFIIPDLNPILNIV